MSAPSETTARLSGGSQVDAEQHIEPARRDRTRADHGPVVRDSPGLVAQEHIADALHQARRQRELARDVRLVGRPQASSAPSRADPSAWRVLMDPRVVAHAVDPCAGGHNIRIATEASGVHEPTREGAHADRLPPGKRDTSMNPSKRSDGEAHWITPSWDSTPAQTGLSRSPGEPRRRSAGPRSGGQAGARVERHRHPIAEPRDVGVLHGEHHRPLVGFVLLVALDPATGAPWARHAQLIGRRRVVLHLDRCRCAYWTFAF
jgi:hypothetical protein